MRWGIFSSNVVALLPSYPLHDRGKKKESMNEEWKMEREREKEREKEREIEREERTTFYISIHYFRKVHEPNYDQHSSGRLIIIQVT